ncbi:kelch domain-containing protein 9-like [Plakobranchus ocellatus]|uniref:Kelch domain-containing protein 9-like n=1 Tax=Plakobranchus ocellatus TaxID=259542 RepID=A0AAV4ARF0_9GAST|nr:kelch domain-containing protein 9-like [Plakobranchus ocellatus]
MASSRRKEKPGQKLSSASVLCQSGTSSAALVTVDWEVVVPLGPKAVFHVGAIIRGSIYIHGGILSVGSTQPSDQFYKLSVGISTMWEKVRTPGSPARSNHSAVVVDDRYLVLIGGWDGRKRIPDIHVYDVQEDIWFPVRHFGFPDGAGLSSHTANLLASGDILVVGREGSLRIQRRHGNAYILSGSIQRREYTYKEYSREVTSRSGHTADIIDNNIYIIGGRNDKLLEKAGGFRKGSLSSCSILSTILEKIESNSQSAMSKLPCGRKNHISAANERCIVVHGGETFDGRSREPVGEMFLIYLRSPTYFYKLDTTHVSRAGHVCLVMNDKVFFHGGFSGRSCVHSDLCEMKLVSR